MTSLTQSQPSACTGMSRGNCSSRAISSPTVRAGSPRPPSWFSGWGLGFRAHVISKVPFVSSLAAAIQRTRCAASAGTSGAWRWMAPASMFLILPSRVTCSGVSTCPIVWCWKVAGILRIWPSMLGSGSSVYRNSAPAFSSSAAASVPLSNTLTLSCWVPSSAVCR